MQWQSQRETFTFNFTPHTLRPPKDIIHALRVLFFKMSTSTDEVGRLGNLQTLTIHKCKHLRMLPAAEVGRLINLTHFEICDCESLNPHISTEMTGSLTNLPFLEIFNCGDNDDTNDNVHDASFCSVSSNSIRRVPPECRLVLDYPRLGLDNVLLGQKSDHRSSTVRRE